MSESANEGPTLAGLLIAIETRDLCDDEALFVLSLIQDGRLVPEQLSSLARAHSAAHPAVSDALADFRLLSEALSEEADEVASAGFTGAVLEQVRGLRAPGPAASPFVVSLPLARRLAVAATVLLALTLSWDALRPAPAAADPAQEHQDYRGDVFRPDPYGPLDLDAGLKELLPGRLDSPPTGSEGGER